MPTSHTPETSSIEAAEAAIHAELEAKKAEYEEMRRLLRVGEHGSADSNAQALELTNQIEKLKKQLRDLEAKR